jgi:GDPmannose 4,6-dehydratase
VLPVAKQTRLTISCWRQARPGRCELAFLEVGRSIEWRGKGVEETGIDRKSGKTVVRIDPTYFRPTEVDELIGDASNQYRRQGL